MGYATSWQRWGARRRIILPGLAAAWDATSWHQSPHIEQTVLFSFLFFIWSAIALLSLLLNEPCARTLPSWCKAIFHRLFLLMCPDGSSLFLFFPDVSNACVACLQSSRRLLKNGCKQHTCDFFLDWRWNTRVVTGNTDPGYIFFGFALYVCWWDHAEATFFSAQRVSIA